MSYHTHTYCGLKPMTVITSDKPSNVLVLQVDDIPSQHNIGQMYFDETSNQLYLYHEEGWTEIK